MAFIAAQETTVQFPSTHIRQHTTACNSSSRTLMPLVEPLLPGDHFVLRPLNLISSYIQLLSLLCCPFTYALKNSHVEARTYWKNRKHLHVLSPWEQGHLHSQPENPLKKVLDNINSNQDLNMTTVKHNTFPVSQCRHTRKI